MKNLFRKQNNREQNKQINSDVVEDLRRDIKRLFAKHIEELQDLNAKPEYLTKVAIAYQNLILHFAIPISYPDNQYYGEEGFEMLVKLMNSDMKNVLNNNYEEFQNKVLQLAKNINKTIKEYRFQNAIENKESISFKDVNINELELPIITDKKNNKKETIDDSTNKKDDSLLDMNNEENIPEQEEKEEKKPSKSKRKSKPIEAKE